MKDDYVELYVKKHGLEGAKAVIAYLTKEEPFMEAIQSEVGGHFLAMVVADTNNTLTEFMNKLAVEGEHKTMNSELVTLKADYQAGMRLIQRVRDRILRYQKEQL